MTCIHCSKPTHAKGLCLAHYNRLRRHGNPLGGRPTRPSICSHRECSEPHYAKGYCHIHWKRIREGISLDKPLPIRQSHCDVEGCDRKHYSKGLCNPHWSRLRSSGDVQAEKPITRLSAGGRIKDHQGYILVWTGKKHEREHRVMMEKHLGRKLYPKESVHHKNGIKDDNRIENLELWSSSHPSGQRVVDKIAWAKEFLALHVKDELYNVETDR